MGIEQEIEWVEAQKIALSVDLVEAAKKQLEFLAAVDRNRYLYEDAALQWAIYRYNVFWIPLLAKHMENPLSEDSLVPPLDCEWIWHCHRLNPIRYKSDCEELFGKTLGNHNVISSVQVSSKSTTEGIWNEMYPEEPYELDFNRPFPVNVLQGSSQTDKFTSYDLLSAVKRQIDFTYQVSRPHMSDDIFLQEAVARYKGFLHLIRTNKEKGIKCLCVPTYDVDLIWHSHQLNPISYCKDMNKLVRKVLHHNDSDTDKSRMEMEFVETTKQWGEMFGLSYWKAGTMSRGSAPTPVTRAPFNFAFEGKEFSASENSNKLMKYPALKSMEILVEIVEVKNLPEHYDGNLVLVTFGKKQRDKLFRSKSTLNMSSRSTEPQVAHFQCEPTGEFVFELVSSLPLNKPSPKSWELVDSCLLPLQDLLASQSLSVDKWLVVKPAPCFGNNEPILLHVSVSFTPPIPAPQVFHLVWSQPFSKHSKTHSRVVDDGGNNVFSLHMRDAIKNKNSFFPDLMKEIYCIKTPGEKQTLLAECLGDSWTILGPKGSFKLRKNTSNDGHLFELVGYKTVKIFPGRRLDFEVRHCTKKSCEQDFATAVEFSKEYPYGRAVALMDFKSGAVKVMDEWMALLGITSAFILSIMLKKEEENIETAKAICQIDEGLKGDCECECECELAIEGGRCSTICHKCNNCVNG